MTDGVDDIDVMAAVLFLLHYSTPSTILQPAGSAYGYNHQPQLVRNSTGFRCIIGSGSRRVSWCTNAYMDSYLRTKST